MALIKKRRRIGLVGMYSSGKTVFLTSLINHLQRHDPRRLPLGRGDIVLRHVRNENVDGGLPEFPYEHCRAQLHGRNWPDKTRETSAFRMVFQREAPARREKLRRLLAASTEFDVSFVDIPGERLADMSIAGQTYEQWSDRILEFMDGTREYQEPAAEYLDLMRSTGTLAEEPVLGAYRRTLARLIHRYLPVISPSSFLVGANRTLGDEQDPARSGSYPADELLDPARLDDLAQARVSGLRSGEEFAPLSAGRRAANPELSAAFGRRYRAYARHVAKPLAEHFRECDVLVLLFDVTMLLMAGVGMYNGNRQMLRLLLNYVDPGLSSGEKIVNSFLKFVSGGWLGLTKIEKLAMVATKADRVHERDRTRMHDLLRDMAGSLVDPYERRKNVAVEYFVCSAVDSTRSHEYPRIEGRFLVGARRFSRAVQVAPTTPLPARWPDRWTPGTYFYPECAPDTPDNEQAAPDQIGLDRLVTFMLGL